MTDDRKKEGTAETLRGVALILLVGVGLGLAFNALGLASRPPRGLSWIARPEKMPSLEELQPGSQAIPAPAPARRPALGFTLVGTAWAQEVAVLATAADTTHARAAKHAVVRKKTAAKKSAAAKAATKPAAPAPATAAPATAAAKVDLPVVPDLDQPIEVKLPNVKKFFDAGGAVLVDAREASEFAEGHIPGALSVPTNDAVANPALLEPLKKAGKPIIAYCSGGDCEESKDLAKNMLAAGIHKVLVFTDGFPAWKAAGYPVETGPPGAGR
jgi:rhodanese-related sulfurtransferase